MIKFLNKHTKVVELTLLVVVLAILLLATVIFFQELKTEQKDTKITNCSVTIKKDLAPRVIKVEFEIDQDNVKNWIIMEEKADEISNIPSPFYYTYSDGGQKEIKIFLDTNQNGTLDSQDLSKVCGNINLE